MLKIYLIKGLALLTIGLCYWTAQPEKLNDTERAALGATFNFNKLQLPVPAGTPKYVRSVHPQYQHIAAWISSVGAAATIDDLDGDGLSNDLIYVDPRYDEVIITSIKGIQQKLTPAVLKVQQLPYNTSTMAPMGTLTYDFNADGRTDILVYYWGRTPVIFLNNGDGYTECELTTSKERWYTNAATLADFDGDGRIDVLISNYFPDGSRVLDSSATDKGQTMQHSMSRANNGGKNHFFLSAGTVANKPVFKEDKSWWAGIKNPEDWTLGVGAVDLTGDMLPELYIANDFGPDKFLLNLSAPGKLKFKVLHGEKKLTTTASSVLGKDSYKGMGVSMGDMNNDGLLDMYVSNIAGEYALEESHFAFINTGEVDKYKAGIAPFVNQSEALGLSRSSWGWESKLADLNNDGILEALQATGFMKGTVDRWPELQELALGNDNLLKKPGLWPNFQPGDDLSGSDAHVNLFVKGKTGRYFDLASEAGIGDNQISRGIAIADVDNDGDLDVLVANQWQDSYLYENKHAANQPDFVGLKIFQPVNSDQAANTNNASRSVTLRPAIGAVVNLYQGNKRIQTSFVDGGNGHSGKNSKEVFFGVKPQTGNLYADIAYRNQQGQKRHLKVPVTQSWNKIILPN